MNTLLVVLEMNDADTAVLQWADLIRQRRAPERIVLLALDDPIAMEAELAAYLPELLEEAPPLADLLDYLEQLRQNCSEWAPRVETEVRRGREWREVLQAAREVAADLVLLARSLGQAESADQNLSFEARRIVRKAPCDVLCTPKMAPDALKRVLVPIDFSARSRGALKIACELVEPKSGHVSLLHIFAIPRGAATKPAELEALAGKLEAALLDKLSSFAADVGAGGIVERCAKQSPRAIAVEIVATAQANSVELLCLGSRGRTALAAMALGSVAEQTLESANVAVYVHKEKGETMGLLEALGIS